MRCAYLPIFCKIIQINQNCRGKELLPTTNVNVWQSEMITTAIEEDRRIILVKIKNVLQNCILRNAERVTIMYV